MFRKIYLFIRKHLLGIDDRSQLEIAVENGLHIGKNCAIMGECILDPGHCFLIEIGDRVTLAPRVHLLAHDASTKRETNYVRIASVKIGNDVFIGAGSIVLPGVTIGDKVTIGAGSVVTKSIPSHSVAAGNPCKIIGSYEDYFRRRREEIKMSPRYGEEWRIGSITQDKKTQMFSDLQGRDCGYIV